MEKGWTKRWRKSLEHPLYKKPFTWHYFDYCITMANHESREVYHGGRLIVVERGSFVTGRKQASKDTGLTEQNIRTAQRACIKLGMLQKSTSKSTSKFSYITVCNYDIYQDKKMDTNHQTNQQVTSNQPASNQQVTTTKNYKNSKNERMKEKDIYASETKEIFDHWNSCKIINHREIEKHKQCISAKLKNYSLEEIMETISNYSAITKSEEHFFSYRWTLKQFLIRDGGFENFLTSNNPFNKYKDDYADSNTRSRGGYGETKKKRPKVKSSLLPGM